MSFKSEIAMFGQGVLWFRNKDKLLFVYVTRCTGACLDSTLGYPSLRLELALSAPRVPAPRGLSQNA
jgi:hypothetical protein